MARKLAAAHGLGDDDVVVDRTALEDLHGALYCLQAALEDVERDLAEAADDPAEVRRALDWLVDNARPAAARLDRTPHRLAVTLQNVHYRRPRGAGVRRLCGRHC